MIQLKLIMITPDSAGEEPAGNLEPIIQNEDSDWMIAVDTAGS